MNARGKKHKIYIEYIINAIQNTNKKKNTRQTKQKPLNCKTQLKKNKTHNKLSNITQH